MINENFCFNSTVGVRRVQRLPGIEISDGELMDSLDGLSRDLGWWSARGGPLGSAVPEGSRVVIKPNFVMHANQGPWGIDPLITSAQLVRVAAAAALQAGAAEVIVGDAPLQSCDFDQLLRATGLDAWAAQLAKTEPRFKGIRDFRRTTCRMSNGVRIASENLQSEDLFVLFDLKGDSLLEPISDGRHSFRVTRYDPRLMASTHAPGKHQYLVARDIIDADVIVNLPKLKTHMKAGLTCALKNLIGINGNKEYLPHHRVGGAAQNGDCYPGQSPVKRAIEYSLDRQNMAESTAGARVWNALASNLDRVARMTGDRLGVEGSWSGNDTIWRTCLDLNRILIYGRSDGRLADTPQRQTVHLVDAIIAGQGNGPLAPQPLPLDLLLAGQNAAAVDWVGAALLRYTPERIPIVQHSFERFNWPLTNGGQRDIRVTGDLGTGFAVEVLNELTVVSQVVHPIGWRDASRSQV